MPWALGTVISAMTGTSASTWAGETFEWYCVEPGTPPAQYQNVGTAATPDYSHLGRIVFGDVDAGMRLAVNVRYGRQLIRKDWPGNLRAMWRIKPGVTVNLRRATWS